MLKKAYIITFDKGGVLDSFDYKKFHTNLTTSKGVLDWWHYLQCTYIIIVDTTVTSASISRYIQNLAPNKSFFISHLDLRDHNGWLTRDAWNWINKYSGQLA
jgi:hypothetical protein